MIYNVEITPTAQKRFKKLNSALQDKILQAIEKLAHNPRPNGYKKLISKLECYRVKFGD
jgi:mRNA interferase RelE/StbE